MAQEHTNLSLATRRTDLGLSLRQVAEQLDISPATLMRWERGDRELKAWELEAWARVIERAEQSERRRKRHADRRGSAA